MRLGVALDIRTFKLPKGYDPNRHAKQLPAVLAKEYGAGWRVMSTDLEKMEVTAVREAALAEIADEDDQPATMSGSKQMAKMVTLPAGTKPSDGDKLAALYQAQHSGFFMVKFDPHLLQARLATMTDDEVIARGKLAAALKVKPWEVLLRSRPDGGFEARLPKYTPSEHDSKLAEAAVLIGRIGWYVTVNPKTLVAQVIPAEPPTFPRSFPLDMSALLASDRDVTPLGRILPDPGQDVGKVLSLAWADMAFLLVGGLPNSGKTVLLNDIVSAQLAGGAELVIIDTVDKSADFQWAKPYVRKGGWGCESLAHAVAALSLVYEECQRRAEVLRARGIQKWLDLPENQQFAPILVVFDEVAALMTTEKIPAGIDKNLPEVQEMIQANMLRFKLFRLVSKIIAEMRFVGARMVLSTQITNQNTGLPPTLKGLIGHRVVMGLNASKAQRQQGFSDETAVPSVPGNVATDPQAGLGVGLAHLQATKPCVFKPFFATVADLTTALDSLDLPRTSWPEPSPSDVARFASIGGTDDADLDDTGEPLVLGGRPDVVRNDDGLALKGAAAAAAASKRLADAPAPPPRPKCQDCGTPIQTDGSCRCA
jgi:hypothetical protein